MDILVNMANTELLIFPIWKFAPPPEFLIPLMQQPETWESFLTSSCSPHYQSCWFYLWIISNLFTFLYLQLHHPGPSPHYFSLIPSPVSLPASVHSPTCSFKKLNWTNDHSWYLGLSSKSLAWPAKHPPTPCSIIISCALPFLVHFSNTGVLCVPYIHGMLYCLWPFVNAIFLCLGCFSALFCPDNSWSKLQILP